MELVNTIKSLTDRYGVSGDEFGVSAQAAELLRPYMDRVEVDKLGNVIGYRSCGKEGAKKLLLDAHLDQIGFVITEVLEEGFCRFIGMGVDPRMLLGSELTVLTKEGPIPAVVSCIPPHLQKAGDNKKALPIEEMVLDLGMSGEKARETVRVGDYAAFAGEAFQLKNDLLCGKSMDDRACFVCILLALEELKDKKLDVDLIVLGSTKEEVGGHGARARAYLDAPDYAIAIAAPGTTSPKTGSLTWAAALSSVSAPTACPSSPAGCARWPGPRRSPISRKRCPLIPAPTPGPSSPSRAACAQRWSPCLCGICTPRWKC